MAKTLLILGNGFDLSHNIKSSYSDFKEYLKLNRKRNDDLFSKLEDIYDDAILWKDFETALGYPKMDFVQNLNKIFGCSLGDVIVDELKNEFYRWARNLDSNFDKQIRPNKYTAIYNLITNNNKFFTFNYTETLEDVYKIDSQNILHIHGEAGETYFPDFFLLFGHGIPYKEGEHIIITNTRKNVAKNIKNKTSKMLQIIDDVNEVVVFGVSYSEIDYLYFEFINNKISPFWTFYFYDESSIVNINVYIKNMNLKENKFKIIKC